MFAELTVWRENSTGANGNLLFLPQSWSLVTISPIDIFVDPNTKSKRKLSQEKRKLSQANSDPQTGLCSSVANVVLPSGGWEIPIYHDKDIMNGDHL